MANYIPISLLPLMSKISEKLMYVRVVSFLNQQNFFDNFQFGFRKNYTTSHACSLMIEKIVHAFEDKRYVLGIFLDLSKAFDSFDHRILLDKLHEYGTRGLAHTWFRNYLTERTQQVKIGYQLSASKSINFGVPQGFILGPLLFLIYVDDVSNALSLRKSLMFADDTSIFLSEYCYKTLYNNANNELEKINNWLIANKLFLNIKKNN